MPALTFDSLAADYDATFGPAPAGRMFRFRLAERVTAKARPPARVLDLGCGTGEDGLWLSAQGYAVHGIDESPRMIEVARSKATRLGAKATFECQSIEGLSGAAATFDVVISNFGALNCLPLASWAGLVPRLLTPSGRAFVVLLGRKPLPEGVRRGFGAADRGRTVEVRVGQAARTIHYESATAVRAALSALAIVDSVEALGCLVPGPGYAGFARRHPLLLGTLAMAESVVRSKPWFRDRGDHTLFEVRRR